MTMSDELRQQLEELDARKLIGRRYGSDEPVSVTIDVFDYVWLCTTIRDLLDAVSAEEATRAEQAERTAQAIKAALARGIAIWPNE